MRTFLAAAMALSLFSAAVAGPTPIGKWKGTIKVTLPDNIPAEQRATAQKSIDALKNMIMKLEIKKGNSYTMTASESPLNPTKTATKNGKWTQKGNVVTMTETSSTPGRPIEFKLAPNGKSMVSEMKSPATGSIKIILSRV